MTLSVTQQAVVVLLRPGPRWVADKSIRQQPGWKQHAAYLDALFGQGVLRLAGPFAEGRGLMQVYESVDEETARKLVTGDPWVAQGVAVVERILGWTIMRDRDRS